MEKINFLALGGQDENGKNCYILEIDSKLFVINSGTKVPINSHNGIDTLIADTQYLEKHQKNIEGVFITDVHNESFSALPWLLMNIKGLKIYTSSFNKFVILDRISKYNIEHNDFEVITLNQPKKFGNVLVTPLNLAGALPGILGFNFNVRKGNILFLTNFVNGNLGPYGNTNFKRIKEKIGDDPVEILIMDSGKSNSPGKTIDKLWVSQKIEYKFKEAKKDERIIVGLYDEDMITAHEVLLLAKKYNRPVITYGRNYSILIELVKKMNPKLQWPEFIDYRTSNSAENAVILVTGAIERLYARFLRIASQNDVYLKIKDTDCVIIIAPPVNGLEVNYALTLDEIARNTPNIIELTSSEYYSCNPAKQDLIDVIKFFRPKHFIPIQGLYRYFVLATQEATAVTSLNKNNCIILNNGKVAEFTKFELTSQKHTIRGIGDVIIDGFGVGDISHEVIKERETLARDGMIAVSCLIDHKTKKPISELSIVGYGVISSENKEQIHGIINKYFKKELEENGGSYKDLRETQERLRRVFRKRIFRELYKEPLVVVTLYEI
ncbi:ribonuclease J [Mycoplasma phocoenae]|uniref:Ribonuclease J n=1 Tax=Mycoplasma phocoenae TaxID=754517 RepID=A0A858U7H8_9MOLU|nr:ribonuclease J [Mycoplasma phocoenae]QJG67215.1 ribonuclease J [Mycoplasma phocoenae]